ncbi:hypothetical protein QFZ37_003711 [Chryseobacterium ginsenosidimutans]|nr:hypothetical protein [Chryseobacterium ginsenosidimutans]
MNSVLGNVQEWKRSHYIILSEIIKEELSEAEELKGEKKIRDRKHYFACYVTALF